ncbi:MAG: hypothetical protein HY518_04865 [Candidatus Aenigmarchaeota archaeon]|nr:hypothetical protein [Candidatus Aenigmarchaeota archaeon]
MDKKAVVRMFLERGVLLSKEVLDKIDEGNVAAHLESQPQIVLQAEKENTVIDVEYPEVKARLMPEDFHRHVVKKYELIRGIIAKKVDAMSINTAKKEHAATVIGVVKSSTGNGFILEDPTGEIDVISSEGADPGDIVAVVGGVKEGIIIGEEIIHPDIPMIRGSGSIDGMLTVRLHDKGMVLNTGGKVTHIGAMITRTTLRKAGGSVMLLAFLGEATKEMATSWLKKRQLPTRLPYENALNIMEQIPDFLIVASKAPFYSVYKGVAILGVDKEKSAEINLRTKEAVLV